jgi:hypothetical protein
MTNYPIHFKLNGKSVTVEVQNSGVSREIVDPAQ